MSSFGARSSVTTAGPPRPCRPPSLGPSRSLGAQRVWRYGPTRRILKAGGSSIMPPHSIGSGTISFGLVSIPVKMYTAASSAGVSFHLLHAKCGNRIKMQQFCSVCNEVVDRAGLVKGYEFAKDQYV